MPTHGSLLAIQFSLPLNPRVPHAAVWAATFNSRAARRAVSLQHDKLPLDFAYLRCQRVVKRVTKEMEFGAKNTIHRKKNYKISDNKFIENQTESASY